MTRFESPMKARKSSTIFAKTGLSFRTAAVWPWTRAASSGTSRSGLMSTWKTLPVRLWCTISTAPISSTRCPSAGSRPVVSVSRTTSRMAGSTSRQRRGCAHELGNDGARHLELAVCVDDEMGPAPLIGIRCLARKDGLEFGLGHARARKRARALDGGRSAYHDHEINTRFPTGLERQWHVDDDEATARGRRALDKVNARLGHRRMHQPFKALQRLCITQHPRSQSLAINLARDRDAWKRRLDRFRPVSGVESAHGVIGVECGDAELGEHAGDGRFPHRDRACQAGNDHCPAPYVAMTSASTSARSAGVTTGRLPNQRAKAGAAWWSSMPSPSATRSPRALAASISGVRKGT